MRGREAESKRDESTREGERDVSGGKAAVFETNTRINTNDSTRDETEPRTGRVILREWGGGDRETKHEDGARSALGEQVRAAAV